MIRYDMPKMELKEDPDHIFDYSDEKIAKFWEEIDAAVSKKQREHNLTIEQQGEVNELLGKVFC